MTRSTREFHLLTSSGLMRGVVGAVVVLIVLIALFSAVEARAQYVAKYNYAVDGDTANIDIYLTDSLIRRGNVRLSGVDTPELRGKCQQEKWLAVAAKNYLDRALSSATAITITPVKWSGKYGRPVVRVNADGADLSDLLIRSGMGRIYDGGRRGGWCD